jgi:hypothetical protein
MYCILLFAYFHFSLAAPDQITWIGKSPHFPSAQWSDFSSIIKTESGNPLPDIQGAVGCLVKVPGTQSPLNWILLFGRSEIMNGSQTILQNINIPIDESTNFDNISPGSWIMRDQSSSMVYPSTFSFSPRTDAIYKVLLNPLDDSPYVFVYGGSDWRNNGPFSLRSDYAILNLGTYQWQDLIPSVSTRYSIASFANGFTDYAFSTGAFNYNYIISYGTLSGNLPVVNMIDVDGAFAGSIDFIRMNTVGGPDPRIGNQMVVTKSNYLYTFGGVSDKGVSPELFHMYTFFTKLEKTICGNSMLAPYKAWSFLKLC